MASQSALRAYDVVSTPDTPVCAVSSIERPASAVKSQKLGSVPDAAQAEIGSVGIRQGRLVIVLVDIADADFQEGDAGIIPLIAAKRIESVRTIFLAGIVEGLVVDAVIGSLPR